jgi:hypothetical protein
MTGLDIFTFVVMFVLLTAVAVLIRILGALPGKLARSRAHTQADAINVCGWLGILTLGLLWPVALIWAYTRSSGAPGTPDKETDSTQTVKALKQTIASLSQQLEILEQQQRDTATQGGKDS